MWDVFKHLFGSFSILLKTYLTPHFFDGCSIVTRRGCLSCLLPSFPLACNAFIQDLNCVVKV